MSVLLRPYQLEAVEAVWTALLLRNRALCVMPTGAGKTECFIKIVEEELQENPSSRICVVMGRVDLVKQTAVRFMKALKTIDIGIYCAQLKQKNLRQKITIASVQSIPAKSTFDLLIIDECHAVDYQKGRYSALAQNSGRIIGFTATPYRPEGYLYGDGKFFREIDFQLPMKDLIDMGFLVRPVAKRVNEQFDLTGLQVRGGEFVQEQVNNLTERDDKIDAQLADAMIRLEGRKKVAWQCSSIKHAEMLWAKLKDAAIVHSQLTYDERTFQLNSFVKGDKRHMVFVTILSEGFDFPPIDAICLMRPTKSPVLYVQTVGRGLRPFAGKQDCLVLDYGKVVETLGTVDRPFVSVRVPGARTAMTKQSIH